MNKPRQTQKQKQSSQTIHPLFRGQLISLLTTSTGRKRRLLLVGIIAALGVVAPEASMTRGSSYLQFRPISINLVIRKRKTTSLSTRQEAQTAHTVAVSETHPLVRPWRQFVWHWQSLSAFIDLSQTTRGSPAVT